MVVHPGKDRPGRKINLNIVCLFSQYLWQFYPTPYFSIDTLYIQI